MAIVALTAPQNRKAMVVTALRVFGEIGVTAKDLRELADAMDAANQKAAGRGEPTPRPA